MSKRDILHKSLSFDARDVLKQNGYQQRLRLHALYILWIPQVPVLSGKHGDKKDLINTGAIFTAIRRDLLPSKVLHIIREIFMYTTV